MLLVNNWLMVFVDVLFNDHWLMMFMDDFLMMFVENIFLVFHNDIFVMFVDYVLMILLNDGLCNFYSNISGEVVSLDGLSFV